MTLIPILVFTIAALLIGWLIPTRLRIWLVLAASSLAIFWLQPSLPIRNLDFWLPVASIILTLFVWSITHGSSIRKDLKVNLTSGLVIVGAIVLVSSMRYLDGFCCVGPGRPPEFFRILPFFISGCTIAALPIFLPKTRHFLATLAIVLIIGLFVVLKSPLLLQTASLGLRNLTGQPVDLANPQDIIWFGFSFLAFRLLHVLFDYRSGRLADANLGEFATYTIFFPTLPAGPIDRLSRFISDLRIPKGDLSQNRLDGAQRIIWGVFKKFVLADSLALVALNSLNATQVNSPFWMWLLVYTYALRIYLDFSGYTDVALGVGRLLGFHLPENFDRPYLKQNLTAFWNSWHITLAGWFRAYYFNPLTRSLRSKPQKLPTWSIIMIGQFSTMLLIGLWHGITWNFAIWGLWHGLGLFIHNRYSDWVRPHLTTYDSHPKIARFAKIGGWWITFNYVALGWVWFALPSVSSSLMVFQKLLGN